MGLGLYLQTPEFRASTAPQSEPSDLLDGFAREMRSALKGHALFPFAHFTREGSTLSAELYPGEEAVMLRVEDGRLILSAKTSCAGPGYHAWLVDLLDEVSAKLKVHWQSSELEAASGDETGYREHRDFGDLQRAHARWLRGLARHLMGEELRETTNLSICLPPYFQVVGEYYAATPRGFLERSTFASLAEMDLGALAPEAEGFFPWWGREHEGDGFYEGLADVLCWSVVPWRVPYDAAEQALLKGTLSILKRCSMPLTREVSELEALLEPEAEVRRPPHPEGRGYFRRSLKRPFAGGWTIILPGYYYSEPADDGSRVFWFGGRIIRLSAYHVQAPSREYILGDTFDDKTGGETLTFESEHGLGRGFVVHEEGFSMLRAGVAAEGRLAAVTITFENPDDEAWAIRAWKSVR